ncbi:MAG: serine/threonine protein kinase, partial [Proteobacteria bacterium]|nr:serine/threonine protein kinase [Pseudomonadota bacterium]
MIQTPPELAHKYRYIDLLGEGANGKTYLARTTLNDERVAIKALKLSQIENFKSLDLFQREAEVLE